MIIATVNLGRRGISPPFRRERATDFRFTGAEIAAICERRLRRVESCHETMYTGGVLHNFSMDFDDPVQNIASTFTNGVIGASWEKDNFTYYFI